MAVTTGTAIANRARQLLADDRVSGGELFTDAVLLPHINQAIRDLFRCLRNIGDPRIIKEKYFQRNPDTAVIQPSASSMSDILSPIEISERDAATPITVTGAAVNGTSLRITAVGHGRSVGQRIAFEGDLANFTNVYGLWPVGVVVDPDTFDIRFLGGVSSGSFGSSQVIYYSANEFEPMQYVERIQSANAFGSKLGFWSYEDRLIRFNACSSARHLRIRYISTATDIAAIGDAVNVEDSLDFLGFRAAALAGMIIMPDVAERLNLHALGQDFQLDGSGGLLKDLLWSVVRTWQDRDPESRTRAPFRYRPWDESSLI